MTNEEAIAELKDIYQNALDYKDVRTLKTFNMAISALESQRWIPVTERLPEEQDTMFAKYYGTEKWRAGMIKKASDYVLVTVEYPDGKRSVLSARTVDGVWKVNSFFEIKFLAWMPYPLPQPPKEER